jgi:hypothetical protein
MLSAGEMLSSSLVFLNSFWLVRQGAAQKSAAVISVGRWASSFPDKFDKSNKMRILLITFLTTISLGCLGQQWAEYKVDSILMVTIPDNYQVRDTLGQRVITSRVDNGLILISVLPNTGQTAINVQNEKDLIDSYKNMREGFIESQHGQLIEEKIIDISGLKLIRFSFGATMGEEKQIRHCVSLFIKEKTYSINFWEAESITNEKTADREKLFSSIKFQANLGLKNQMSNAIEGTRSYNLGYITGKILGYGLMIALVIALVKWISKRGKKKSTNAQQNA